MIVEFVKKLAGSFTRNDVKNKIRILVGRIEEYTLPNIEKIKETSARVDSPLEKELFGSKASAMRSLFSLLPPVVGKNMTAIIEFAANNSSNVLSEINSKIDRKLPDKIVAEGITFSSANVLRFVDVVDFFNEYTSRYLYHLTMSTIGSSIKILPIEKRYLENNAAAYIEALRLLVSDKDWLLTNLDKSPEITVNVVDPKQIGLNATQADPLRMNLIPFITPLFGRIGMNMVDHEISKTERLKLEKRGIQMAIERNRQATLGAPDARAEAIMEGWKKELDVVNAKLARLEG